MSNFSFPLLRTACAYTIQEYLLGIHVKQSVIVAVFKILS